MKLVPVVEGHGEVAAVPELLRRLQYEASCFAFEIGTAVRRNSSDLNNRLKFQEGLQIAVNQTDCAAILILFDLDDGCPKEKAAELAQWARESVSNKPCAVVLAYREYEAWFLAAMESLRGYNGIADNAVSPRNPESIRGAKQHLEKLMAREYSYSETADQVRLTTRFDMVAAYYHSRSFRRLVSAFGQLLMAMGQQVEQWPPAHWMQAG